MPILQRDRSINSAADTERSFGSEEASLVRVMCFPCWLMRKPYCEEAVSTTRMLRCVILCLFLLLMGLTGCVGLSTSKPPGPWYEAYQPINDPASNEFLTLSLEKAQTEFGEPAVPIKKILLRRSKKTDEARRYRIGEDFSLTECEDPTNGVFVVYIGEDPGEANYYALLAHESVHLLDPQVVDWYMEGIATVFSEQACAELGQEWGDWKSHFQKSRRDPYALSYRMMRDLQDAFPEYYPRLVHYTAPRGNGSSQWRRIDIDAWIMSLPSERRREAVKIIEPYASSLRKYTSKLYAFTVPQDI